MNKMNTLKVIFWDPNISAWTSKDFNHPVAADNYSNFLRDKCGLDSLTLSQKSIYDLKDFLKGLIDESKASPNLPAL